MFNASELGSQIKIITFVLLKLEDFGLDLGDEKILLIRFDLGWGEVLENKRKEGFNDVLYYRRTLEKMEIIL